MKKWLKISITTEKVLVEAISDFLVGVVSAGVEVGINEDSQLQTINAFVEKESPSSVEVDTIIDKIRNYISEVARIFTIAKPEISWKLIEEEDWGKSWKSHFKPFPIVPGLIIRPTWEKYEPRADENVLIMDPGLAFGTGHHATTSLVIQLIADIMQQKRDCSSVLDVGTGTGILGIAAGIFGADSIYGIDNDYDAVSIAEENIIINGLQEKMAVSGDNLSEISEKYDLVVANIVHDVLVDLSQQLRDATKEGGFLILSGILQGQQIENIIHVFSQLGYVVHDQLQKNEWEAIIFALPAR